MPTAAQLLGLFAALAFVQFVMASLLYRRWRRVRLGPSTGLPTSRALLRAVENNRDPLGDNPHQGRLQWTVLRVVWTGEHQRIGDARLSRLVYAVRLNTLLALAVLAAAIVAPSA